MIVSLLLAAILVAGIYIASHRLDGSRLLVAFAVLGAGAVLVIVPDLASAAARALGVGRGTDLLLYVVTLTGVFLAAHLYFRSERHAKQLVVMVREIAVLRAEIEGATESRRAADVREREPAAEEALS